MRRCLARSGAACCRGPVRWPARRCAFIARVMGREVVEKLTGKTVLDSMDGFSLATANTPSGLSVIAFCPFRSISYAAGLTSIRFRSFFYRHRAWSITGDYCLFWAGSMLTGGTFWFVTGLFILFALTVVILWRRKYGLSARRGMPDGFTAA